MSENERMDDARFAQQILKLLPGAAVPAALEARILGDFDRVAVRPGKVTAMLARIGERLWPGVPVWQPASVLAVSLVMGLTAGALLPSPGTAAPASDLVVVAALDNPPDIDLDRDQ
jgi:hypothetical protein